MAMDRKIRLVQAAFGAVILSIMMQPVGIIGYGAYLWMVFMPLLLFFAFGADFKLIPSMIVSYICGIGWALVNGVISGLLEKLIPENAVNLIAPIIVIFAILTVHENLLQKTVFGNIPALFMGLASTFFTFLIVPANAPSITPLHLIGLFVYGVILSVVLTGGGFMVCSLIFGKEQTTAFFENQK